MKRILVRLFLVAVLPQAAALSSAVGKKAPFNLGPASSRDLVLWTAERPGNPLQETEPLSDAKVQEWIEYVKNRGISQVVSLLDENELTIYEPTGLIERLRQGGLTCSIQSMSAPEAARTILSLIDSAEANNERIVTHCTGGIGRCGRVAAAWLVHRYNLSPDEATKEVLEQARKSGVTRKGDADNLQNWLSNDLRKMGP